MYILRGCVEFKMAVIPVPDEPRREKTGLPDLRLGPTQTELYSHSLKFRIKGEEKLYYIYTCSENKGADQLRSYCEADLRLCLRIGKHPIFSRCGSDCLVL